MTQKQNNWPVTRHQLRAGRILAGLRVRQFAQMVGMSCTTINQIEKGHTKSPLRRTVVSLRDALQSTDIEFAPGGWVRLRSDAGHLGDGEEIDAPLPAAQEPMDIERAMAIVLAWLRERNNSELTIASPEVTPSQSLV